MQKTPLRNFGSVDLQPSYGQVSQVPQLLTIHTLLSKLQVSLCSQAVSQLSGCGQHL